MGKVFANVPGDRDSIPVRVMSKTPKWYLMLKTQHCRVRIKGK